MKQLLKGARVVDPQVELDGIVDVLIDGNKIVQVARDIPEGRGIKVHDLSGKVLVPGLVDIHVHLREPGFEYKETIESGCRAAAHGGFTDIAPMPNTKPVIDDGAAVKFLVEKAEECGCVHVRPVGAITKGRAGSQLAEMGDMVQAGICAISDDGGGVQDAGMVRRAMDYAKMFDLPLMEHCQDEALVGKGQVNEGVASTRLGLAGWPAQGEEIMIGRDIEVAGLTGCHIHIQHLTTAHAVELVTAGKEKGVDVTCEVTPHHLFLCEDDIDDTYDTNLKMNPPLRTAADRDALQEALIDGRIDCVVTDHAPHAAHEKAVEFELAPFGTTGLETSLPLMLTHLVGPGRMGWDRLVEAMAIAPRDILGLEPVRICEGSEADITVIDPDATFMVTEDFFESKSTNSAFLGQELTGRAWEVYVSGKQVLKDGEVI